MHEINEKQRKFAINFIIYIITFCFLALIGISRTFADTNINMSTWTNVTGRKWSSNNYESSSNIITDTDTIRAYYNVSSPIYTPPNLYDYVDFLYFQHNGNFNPCNGDDFKTNFYLKFSVPSFVNYVSRVRFSYHSDTGLDSCIISSRNSTSGRVDVSCSTHYESNSDSLIIWVDFNRNIPDTQNSWLYIQKNFSLSCMTNSQAIINNQNQNTQNIINNNNQNTQDIINNNNENTQQIIESNKVCSFIDKNNISIDNKSMDINGALYDNTAYGITDYINISKSDLSISSVYNYNYWGANICYYTINKSLISCEGLSNTSSLTIPNNAYYFRSTIYKYDNKPTYKICTDGNQALSDDNKEAEKTRKGILGKLKDLFNWLTNDDDADVSSAGDTAGWLPPGPIDSIITLPLTMLNNINSSLNKTCSPLNVNLPYVNKSVEIPCLSDIFNQITGLNSFWTWVGLISSVVILYRYLIELYKYYDRLTTLQANFISDWGSI